MAWVFLLLAGLCEVAWPLGLKLSQTTRYFYSSILFAVAGMAISGVFLFLAQKQISIGVAYSIWTGICAVGTFLVGLYLFHDTASFFSWLGIILIITGIILLKASH